MSRMIIGKCSDCGKPIHHGAYTRTTEGIKWVDGNFRNFNDGKIQRCLECCEKQGIKKFDLKGQG
ncbi:MAG: hypothetical protein GX568_08840 [Candidatus Gastranaerophilales bacterium]|nr:hypothetical protein [Candidatus Gastranaerophilales bacterium]